MSASTIDDFKRAKARDDATKIQAVFLDTKYVNLPKESIVDELGKPHEIIHKGYEYFSDQNCRHNDCPFGKSDEVWIYQFRDRDERGIHSYQIWIYIKEGKIVRIEG